MSKDTNTRKAQLSQQSAFQLSTVQSLQFVSLSLPLLLQQDIEKSFWLLLKEQLGFHLCHPNDILETFTNIRVIAYTMI